MSEEIILAAICGFFSIREKISGILNVISKTKNHTLYPEKMDVSTYIF
jgi:hypothetical protein